MKTLSIGGSRSMEEEKRKNERFVPFDGISNYPMKRIPADRIVEL